MYRITVKQYFDAAHFLIGYKGKCENLHGHRYQVVINVMAAKTDEIGLAYDFAELKKQLKNILDKFDHTCLNDVPPFNEKNPSAENIAAAIHSQLKPKVKGAELEAVEVWESPDSGVEDRGDNRLL
jgi:6-pyruvoyltetrahydropterin/6-carboxytetrahydropterin synthase